MLAAVQLAATGLVLARLRTERQCLAAQTARMQHELAMDAAVFIAKRTAVEAAVAWVRTHVDPTASDVLARELGTGYERYLHELHGRFTRR